MGVRERVEPVDVALREQVRMVDGETRVEREIDEPDDTSGKAAQYREHRAEAGVRRPRP